MERTSSNISLEDDLQNGNEEKRSMEETELESAARLFESRKVLSWQNQLKLRAFVLSFILGILFTCISMKLNLIVGTINFRPQNTTFHNRSRSKRTRAPSNNNWTSTPPLPTTPTAPTSETSKTKRENYASTTSSSCDTTSETGAVMRCTHCASEKMPQWRTGLLGSNM